MLRAPAERWGCSIAGPEHADKVIGVLTRAFASDPPNRWMYPDPAQYHRYFPAFVRALGGLALSGRTAFVNSDCSAAALWLAPDAAPDEQAIMALIENSVAPHRRDDLAAVIDEMGRSHPHEPHWYLPFVGVEPARQGQGLGAAVLQPVLAECDATGLPAYLESTNPRNQAFYERHGFAPLGKIKRGECPPIVPMLRPSRPQAR
jgi:GNAT superfamily N-acetyltransferase